MQFIQLSQYLNSQTDGQQLIELVIMGCRGSKVKHQITYVRPIGK